MKQRIALVNQKEVAIPQRSASEIRAGRRLNHTLAQAGWAALLLYFGLVATALAYTEDQARQGAGVFAFYCSTCHGDRGQGLTDEFRATWAPGDQYCWTPKCHGPNHPDDGFVLPKSVTALIGPDTLTNHATAQSLYSFIKVRMPYQDPSLVSDEQKWAVTAFLLREHGIAADGVQLDANAAANIQLRPNAAPITSPPLDSPPAAPPKMPHTSATASSPAQWGWLALGAAVIVAGAVILLVRRSLLNRRRRSAP